MGVFYGLGPAMRPAVAAPSPVAIVAFCLLISVAGMAGDLAESLLKRDSGRDSTPLGCPALGVLDILDSILLPLQSPTFAGFPACSAVPRCPDSDQRPNRTANQGHWHSICVSEWMPGSEHADLTVGNAANSSSSSC